MMNLKIYFRIATFCCILVTINGIPKTEESFSNETISTADLENSTKYETIPKTENSLILRSLRPRQITNELPSFFKSIFNLIFAILKTSQTTLPGSIVNYIKLLIVFSVCALTPYCNMTLEDVNGRDAFIEAWPHIDKLDGYIFESINRYNELQSGVYT